MIQLLKKNFLNALVNCAIKNPKGGIVGPKIRYYDKPNILNSAGGKFIWSLGVGYNIGMGKKIWASLMKFLKLIILWVPVF